MKNFYKKKYLFATLILLFLIIEISTGKAQDWVMVYSPGNLWSVPYNVKETYDQGILVQYRFRKYDGAYIQSAIFKTDINGIKLWEKTFGNPTNTLVVITGLSITPDGGIVICGITTLADEVGDPFVMKLNACMQTEWCNIYHTPVWEDGGAKIHYVPWDNSFIWELYNTSYDSEEKREFVMKLDSSGNTIWYNLFATNLVYTSEIITDLNLSDIDSSFVLNGLVYVYNDSSGWWELNPYWLKVGDNGDFLWEKYGVQHPEYNLGHSRFTTILKSGNIASCATNSPQTYYVLIDKQGNELFSDPLYMPDSIFGSTSNSIEVYKDSILLNGMQYIIAPFDPCCSVIQITDTLGVLKDEIIISDYFDVLTIDLEITQDNKILAVSTYDPLDKKIMLTKYNENFEYDSIYTRPYTYDSLCPGGITSGNIDLGCAIVTGIEERTSLGPAKLTLAPNPAKDFTVVYLPETIIGNQKHGPFDVTTVRSDYVKNLEIQVYNLNGMLFYTSNWPDGTKEQVLNTGSWLPGMYLVRIQSPEKTIASGKLMIVK